MKVVVIGGTGLIGAKLVGLLQQAGHAAVAASPSRGIDAVSGQGLAHALAQAEVVVDVANAPSFEDQPVLDFSAAPRATFWAKRQKLVCNIMWHFRCWAPSACWKVAISAPN